MPVGQLSCIASHPLRTSTIRNCMTITHCSWYAIPLIRLEFSRGFSGVDDQARSLAHSLGSRSPEIVVPPCGYRACRSMDTIDPSGTGSATRPLPSLRHQSRSDLPLLSIGGAVESRTSPSSKSLDISLKSYAPGYQHISMRLSQWILRLSLFYVSELTKAAALVGKYCLHTQGLE